MAVVSVAEALDKVRVAHLDRDAAEAALLSAIHAARRTPGVTMDQIAREAGYSGRDGLYRYLRTRKEPR